MTSNPEISHTAQEVKQYDYDRWLSSLFAPADKRDNLFAVQAFNTEIARIRETVSEPMLGDIRLQWWREALEGLKKGTSKTHPVVQALHNTGREISLDYSLMQEMVDMRTKDLDPTPLETMEHLIAYADGTGGALHRLMNAVLGGAENSTDVEAANRAGRAYALVGIIRAIPFHFQNDLVLLPIHEMEKTGVTRNTIFQEEHRESFLKLILDLSLVAAGELRAAKSLAVQADRPTKASRLVNGISSIYLKRLKSAGNEPSDPKLMIRPQRKILALVLQSFA